MSNRPRLSRRGPARRRGSALEVGRLAPALPQRVHETDDEPLLGLEVSRSRTGMPARVASAAASTSWSRRNPNPTRIRTTATCPSAASKLTTWARVVDEPDRDLVLDPAAAGHPVRRGGRPGSLQQHIPPSSRVVASQPPGFPRPPRVRSGPGRPSLRGAYCLEDGSPAARGRLEVRPPRMHPRGPSPVLRPAPSCSLPVWTRGCHALAVVAEGAGLPKPNRCSPPRRPPFGGSPSSCGCASQPRSSEPRRLLRSLTLTPPMSA